VVNVEVKDNGKVVTPIDDRTHSGKHSKSSLSNRSAF
jgi:hypothetical protein